MSYFENEIYIIGGSYTETSRILHFYTLLEHILVYMLMKHSNSQHSNSQPSNIQISSQTCEYYVKINIRVNIDNNLPTIEIDKVPTLYEFETVKSRLIKNMQQQNKDPFILFYDHINKVCFHSNHAASRPLETKIKSIQQCSYEKFIDFFIHALSLDRVFIFEDGHKSRFVNIKSFSDQPVFSLTKLRNVISNEIHRNEFPLQSQIHYVYLPIISTYFLIHIHLDISFIKNHIKTFDCIGYIVSIMLRQYNVKCTLYIDYFDPRLSYFTISGSGLSVENDIFEIINALSPKDFKSYITKDIIRDFNENSNPKDQNPNENSNHEKITELIVFGKSNNDKSQISEDISQISRNEIYHTYKKYFGKKINLIYCGPNELFNISDQ